MTTLETPAAPRNTEEQLVRPKFTAFLLPALMFTIAASQFGTPVIAETGAEFWVGFVGKHLVAFSFFMCGVVSCLLIVEDYVTSRSHAGVDRPAASAGTVGGVVDGSSCH